jgi:hypothetical protein
MSDAEKDVIFALLYNELSKLGHCDGVYGAEFKRVLAEYTEAGRPDDAEEFIKRRANWVPT